MASTRPARIGRDRFPAAVSRRIAAGHDGLGTEGSTRVTRARGHESGSRDAFFGPGDDDRWVAVGAGHERHPRRLLAADSRRTRRVVHPRGIRKRGARVAAHGGFDIFIAVFSRSGPHDGHKSARRGERYIRVRATANAERRRRLRTRTGRRERNSRARAGPHISLLHDHTHTNCLRIAERAGPRTNNLEADARTSDAHAAPRLVRRVPVYGTTIGPSGPARKHVMMTKRAEAVRLEFRCGGEECS